MAGLGHVPTDSAFAAGPRRAIMIILDSVMIVIPVLGHIFGAGAEATL
jgi:hypothetical protein